MDSPEGATTAGSLKSDMKAAHENNAALPERLEHSRQSRNASTGTAGGMVPPDPLANDSSHTVQPSGSRPMTAQINGTGRHNDPSDQLMNMIESKLEPVNRMQNQICLNGAGVEHNTREIRVIGEAVAMMQAEMRRMVETMEAFRRELYSRPPAGPPPPRGEVPDETLEMFSDQLQGAIRKANEVDELKVQLELLKRKVGRSSTVESSPATGHPYSAQQQTPVHSTPLSQHAMPPIVPHLGMPRPPQPPHAAFVQPYTPEIPPRPIEGEHPSSGAGSGWTSVNTNAKRGYPNGIDAPSEAGDTPLGSPKRQKLAPVEPPHPHGTVPSQPMQYDRMETDEPIHPSRLQPHESYPDSTTSSNFHPYPNTQHADPDDSWRPESQRVVSNPVPEIHRSPRGRPRGRGGRPRKSLPVEPHSSGTPEWEKETWTGSQINQDGFYHSGTPTAPKRGSIVRRGSGGATSGNRIPIPPPPPTQATTINVVDQYAHTKKTRTKPVRNADGILIRKDGRPDMRSQSSAANLRKVHARKEEEKRLEAEAAKAAATTESSPMTPASHDTDVHRDHGTEEEEQAPNTQERTEKILQRMFPHGRDEQKGRLASAESYFSGSGKGTPDRTTADGSREVSEGREEGAQEVASAEAKKEAAA